MYNPSELIKILILKNGLSMRKLVTKMNNAGYEKMTIGGFSKMLKTNSIKFAKVQDILDFLGYEFKVVKKVVIFYPSHFNLKHIKPIFIILPLKYKVNSNINF